MYYIYGLVSRNDGLRYVGITIKTPKHRFSSHISTSRSKTSKHHPVNEWIKENDFRNGISCVVLEEIEESDGIEFLEESEKMWIQSLRFLGFKLLNVSSGGRLPSGYTHSEEQKREWSIARKGSITGSSNPNFGKYGKDHPAYGRKLSEETKKRLSSLKMGKSNPNYGKSPSKETREKQRETTKGIPRPYTRRNAHIRYHEKTGISRPETCGVCREELELNN